MRCTFEEVDGRLVCVACKQPLPPSPAVLTLWRADHRRVMRLCRPAGSYVPTPPSLGRRLLNFGAAAIGHHLNGSPTCTQDEIDARLAVCRECPLWLADPNNADLGTCTHSECGCAGGRFQRYLNKLAWRDQNCPAGLWPKLRASAK